MKNWIRHITDLVDSKYDKGTFEQFIAWWRHQVTYQIDIETNITDWWYDKTLISIQFGSCTHKREQWFLQWSALTSEQKQIIIDELNNDRRIKLAHNGKFEYIVLFLLLGVVLENIYDTMIGEKVLRGGMEIEDYALADISWKYLRIIMDKTLQVAFGDNVITDAKIEYGCIDVQHLDVIKRLQIEEAEAKGLMNVMGLEMDVLPAFSDITSEGMYLNKQKWRENIKLAEPIVEAATNKINDWLNKEPFMTYALTKGYISPIDRVEINFKSHQQKAELLKLIFPDIIGSSAPIMKKYIRDNAMNMSANHLDLLMCCADKNYKPLEEEVVDNHRNYLIEKGYLIPANTSTINWNSRDQVLPLAQLVESRMKDLSEESRNKTTHPMLKDLEKYKSSLKLINDLGEGYIHKYVSPDGKVRGNVNQIVSTGRCSFSNPNMQNIIAGDRAATDYDPDGLRYRNCFYCEEGWSFVDGDYISQELVIIAYISKDPVWMECIEKGWDLHSVCSELVYKEKWKNAAEPNCAYYHMTVDSSGRVMPAKQKCKCQKHKSLRYDCKTINFG